MRPKFEDFNLAIFKIQFYIFMFLLYSNNTSALSVPLSCNQSVLGLLIYFN